MAVTGSECADVGWCSLNMVEGQGGWVCTYFRE